MKLHKNMKQKKIAKSARGMRPPTSADAAMRGGHPVTRMCVCGPRCARTDPPTTRKMKAAAPHTAVGLTCRAEGRGARSPNQWRSPMSELLCQSVARESKGKSPRRQGTRLAGRCEASWESATGSNLEVAH